MGWYYSLLGWLLGYLGDHGLPAWASVSAVLLFCFGAVHFAVACRIGYAKKEHRTINLCILGVWIPASVCWPAVVVLSPFLLLLVLVGSIVLVAWKGLQLTEK